MNGLLHSTLTGYYNQNFVQSTSYPFSQGSSVPFPTTTMDPFTMNFLIGSMMSQISYTWSGDTKLYLRRMCEWGIVTNCSNYPVIVQRVAFKARKSCPLSKYSSYYNLLTDQTFGADNPLQPFTTGNPAQRYLKFGTTKYIKLQPGQFKTYKIQTKFSSPKQISRDVEIDTTLLFTKYTHGYLWKVVPNSNMAYTTSSGDMDRPISASYNIAYRYRNELSFYIDGVSNPTTYFQSYNNPSTGTSAARIFSDDVPQQMLIA